MLPPVLARQWLGPVLPKKQPEQLDLSLDEGPELFEWYRVSPAVGNVRNQGHKLILPAQ